MNGRFANRWILVVEDQPLVALDITDSLQKAGASVLTATTLQHGLVLADHPQLSAAVLDFGLGHDDCDPLCMRLSERQIPFVIYTGYAQVSPACSGGIVVQKPATPQTLLAALTQILASPSAATMAAKTKLR
jgi:DNA-binding response OmpR family regulator